MIPLIMSTLRDRAKILLHDERNVRFFNLYLAVRMPLVGLAKAVFYGPAVFLQIPWQDAYLWRIRALSNALATYCNSSDYSLQRAEKLKSQATKYLAQLRQFAPQLQAAAELEGRIALCVGHTEEWLAAQFRSFEYQELRANKAPALSPPTRILANTFHILVGIGATLGLDTYVKAGILGLRPPTRTVFILEKHLKSRIANPCLLDYWRSYIDFIEDETEVRLLRPYQNELAVNPFGLVQCGPNNTLFAMSAAVFINAKWQQQKRAPLLQLTPEHKARGDNELQKMGIPDHAWLVTLHVRHGSFGNHRINEPFRDADISTYYDAITFITNRGGWVVRMGDLSMPDLPKMHHVVDYAHSRHKSDWMDVYFCASARLMIGTSSGVATVSHAFGIPIAMTKYLPTATLYLSQHDMFIPRLMRRIADGTMRSFSEIMGLPISMGVSSPLYKNVWGLEVIPNTSDEISGLAQEMLDNLDGTASYSIEDNLLQKQFKAITADRETLIGLPGMELPPRIGRHFLNKHKNLLF